MTLTRYRATDLTILLVIMVVLESASLIALTKVGSQFVLSVVMPVTLIVYMRWNGYGLIHAVVGGITQALVISLINDAFTIGEAVKFSVVYGLGYAASAISMTFFIKGGKERVKDRIYMTALYALTAFAATCLIRATVLAIYGESFTDALISHLTREALNFVFTFLVLIIASRQNNFFVDQKEYFFSPKKTR